MFILFDITKLCWLLPFDCGHTGHGLQTVVIHLPLEVDFVCVLCVQSHACKWLSRTACDTESYPSQYKNLPL